MRSRHLRFWQLVLSVVIFCTNTFVFAATHNFELPTELEPEYAKAVIHFNSAQFDKALIKLNSILTRAPQNGKVFELQALCYKSMKKDAEALKTYAQLIKLSEQSSRKFKYYFEAATLLFRAKRYSHARPYFYATIKGGFNEGASHYFLGLMDYEEKQWQPATLHFEETTESSARELRHLGWFYQGLISYRQGNPRLAIRSMHKTLDYVFWALAQPNIDPNEKKTLEDIEETALKVLRDFDKGSWDAALSMVFQYDSNVSILPDTVKVAQQLEGKSTVKQIFTGSVAYHSSPTRDIQWDAAYQLFFNLNYNGDTKNFDFLSHIPSLQVQYLPFNRLRGGVRVSGNYVFQNFASRDDFIEMFPFSLTGDIGGFVAYEPLPRLNVEASGGYLPKKYYQDPGRGEERRTGSGFELKLQSDYTSPWPLLNPGLYIGLEHDNPVGKNWRFSAFKLGLSNLMHFKHKLALTNNFDLSFPRFSERTPIVRNDTYFSWRVAAVKEVMQHVSVFADFNLIRNSSNVNSLFTYTRYFTGIGAMYAF